MDLSIANRVALIPGGSKGLGKACALAFAREGCKVSICARGREALFATAQEIQHATGALALALVADMGSHEDIRRVVAETVGAFGRLDILICNAGGPPLGDPFEFSDEDWHRWMDVNFHAMVRLCREAVPHMRKNRWGRIINITSVTVKQPAADHPLGNSSRLAVAGFAKGLATQLARDGITVNCVAPGAILTDRIRELSAYRAQRLGVDLETAMQERARDIPLGRMGRPEEFADLVAFLASERASYLTGVTIPMDGGSTRAL